jgi:hypothetical protein
MSDKRFSDPPGGDGLHNPQHFRLENRTENDRACFGQKPTGDFFNLAGTVDPESPQGRTYNTTQALVALRALGIQPKFDPLPVFEEILKQDYKTLPAYSTSFFPLAYLCAGKPIPEQADRSIRALMVQDDDGYLNNHIAATFHASHYYSLVGETTPKSNQMVARTVRDQNLDGSWFLNLPSRDRHATFDAVFTLLHEGQGRMTAGSTPRCPVPSPSQSDGGFGHYPGSTSDADANYFHIGTLVMAGVLKPVDPLPRDPHLLSWGHLMPLRAEAGDPSAFDQWLSWVALPRMEVASRPAAHTVHLWSTHCDCGPKCSCVIPTASVLCTVARRKIVATGIRPDAHVWDVVCGRDGMCCEGTPRRAQRGFATR